MEIIKLLSLTLLTLILLNANAQYGPSKKSTSENSVFEWTYRGIEMDKEVYISQWAPGYLELTDGTRYEGDVSAKKVGGVLQKVRIKTPDKTYKIKNKKVAKYGYNMSTEEMLAEKEAAAIEKATAFEGQKYSLKINPNPTHVDPKATKAAVATASLGRVVAVNNFVKEAEETGKDSKIDEFISSASTEDMVKRLNSMIAAGGYRNFEEASSSGTKFYRNELKALNAAIEADKIIKGETKFYYREYILTVKSTGQEIILYNPVYEPLIQPRLEYCDKFNRLEEKEKKKLLKWRKLKEAVALLDEC